MFPMRKTNKHKMSSSTTNQDNNSSTPDDTEDGLNIFEALARTPASKGTDSPSSQVQNSDHSEFEFHQSFTSMAMYSKDMCPKLLYEEQNTLQEDCEVLSHDDASMHWRKTKSIAKQGLEIEIPMTPQFSRRLLSEKMEQMEQNPFFKDQAMALISKTGTSWFGYIANTFIKKQEASVDVQDPTKVLKISVKLYYWNQNEPPSAKVFESMHILPFSTGISRALKAMASISSPLIKEMILGNTQVTQTVKDSNLDFSEMTLNGSQQEAINSVMSNAVTVLQGPPGTGKTTTIAAIVSQCLKMEIHPILVLAASNTAVDNITMKLLKQDDKKILRVVAGVRENDYGKNHCLSKVCLHRQAYKLMPPDIQEIIRRYNDPLKCVTRKEREKMMNQRNPVYDTIISKNKVILATTVVSGGPHFKNLTKVPVVIIDEATQSPEYSTLIPLAFAGIEKVVLVGDRKQLSGYAETPALAVSLFERLLINGTYRPDIMLDTQYRMHPQISEFPRYRFYNGLLFDGVYASDRHINGFTGNRVVFWDTMGGSPESSGMEVRGATETWSYCNMGEVKKIEEILCHLIHQKKIARNRIGIIAPYAGQRNLLSSQIAKNAKLATKNSTKISVQEDVDAFQQTKELSIKIVNGITVSSIDAFQGHEKDFIIFSCVRSNDKGKVGFLNDRRRLNVALTRAKYGLVIVGDAECLAKKDELWKGFISFLREKNWVSLDPEFSFD